MVLRRPSNDSGFSRVDGPDLEALIGQASAPSQAYVFAHRMLPELVFHGGTQALEILTGPNARQRLAAWWSDCGSAPVPPELDVHAVETGGDQALVITMPAPAEDAEAHAVCVYIRPGQAARFFTLERGMDFNCMTPITMLCEWTRDGAHRNLGAGPEWTPQTFAAAITARI